MKEILGRMTLKVGIYLAILYGVDNKNYVIDYVKKKTYKLLFVKGCLCLYIIGINISRFVY